jgi:hypothetical protein
MLRKILLCTALAVLAMTGQTVATRAGNAAPSATAMLFEVPHLAKVSKGATLAYLFERRVSDPKLLGEPFKDGINVDVVNEGDDGTKTVVVKVFTGERGRDPQNIQGMTGNPVLVVFLDRAVNNLALLSGGSRPYLKQKLKMSFLNPAKVEPVEIAFNGSSIKGSRIEVKPYAGDPNALKMMGYDGATFDIVVSDEIPGYFVAFASHYASPMKESPNLDETIKFDGVGEIK